MFTSKKFIRVGLIVVLIMAIGLVSLVQAGSNDIRPDRPLPETFTGLQLDAPLSLENAMASMKLDRDLLDAEGKQQVLVRLSEAPVAAAAAENSMAYTAQLNQRGRIHSQQQVVIAQARAADSNVVALGAIRNALNAVMLEVDASALTELAASPDVVSISRIVDYELFLTETVPYIGGTAVQADGYDGSGIRVAVLDSGVDYYHANLGGSGDPADYAADDPNIIEPGTFPTAKVVGGYDFVGSVWPGGALAPDPDPLDDGPAAGHGTHVADIIAGVDGVAPGADIYAVKVCSSVSTSCSGVALMAGMDFALDPNGDGNLEDAVDIINMSLGANYGTAFDDDLSQAVEFASSVGVLTVSSAGNGADKPYISGTPSNAPSALSVAQTSVPSAVQPIMTVEAPASIAGSYFAVFQPWSVPLTSTITAPVIYGNGAGGNLLGCDPFATDLSGYIVLVDRGACNFSLKISNISQAGGEAGIIGMVDTSAPFAGADGGDRPIDIPGYMISQADANALKSGLPDTVVTFDPSQGIPLVMHMVGSSSRGPAPGSNMLKPEIGAPGASVSANAGTGTGTGPFGGTSGASPMVAGSAALLMEAYPDRSWAEIKAVLMNTAETDIINNPALGGGELAPVSRIGGGEVRVDRALASPAAAWDAELLTGAVSFGFDDFHKRRAQYRDVVIKNYTNERLFYRIGYEYRYDNDEASKAVVVRPQPNFIVIPANQTRTIKIRAAVIPERLPDWTMNSGSNGANPAALTLNEYDGYITFDNIRTDADDDNPMHVAWHILPRKASDIRFFEDRPGDMEYRFRNMGQGDALIESYSLIGKSDNLPEGGPGEQNPTPDLRYFGYATYPVPAGFCSADPSFVMAFAINTWEPVTHLNNLPWYDVFIDVDQDGVYDYNIFNFDLSLAAARSDGRVVSWAVDLATGDASAFFFADHDTNSGNTVLLICGEQIGMNADNFFDPMDVDVLAYDWAYSATYTDGIFGMTISPLGEQYLGAFENGGIGATSLAYREQDYLTIWDFGPLTNNTETGLLLLYRGGNADTEALIIEP